MRPRRVSLLVVALAAALLPASAPAVAEPVGAPALVARVDGTPWEIAVLPGGAAFVTQRDGGIVHVDAAGVVTPALARSAIPSVRKLLGLALAPDFATSGLAYVYVSQSADPDGAGPATGTNGVWRLRATGGTLSVVDQVFGGIDSDGNHDGGRMVFGPDSMLYVTTGDIHQPDRPQDVQSLNGKILRLQVGTTGPAVPPGDNPFVGNGGSAVWVWSLGHRHPQGLVFDARGRLWETEHGPSGERYAYPGGNGQTGRDELNLIERGGNYGWPVVSGPLSEPRFVAPMAVAANSPAWAPGDLTLGADGSLYAPFLAGTELHRFDVRGGVVATQASHLTDLGRLRVAVTSGQDLLIAADGGTGAGLYRLTLGAPPPGGDELVVLPPAEPTSGTVLTTAQVRERARAVTQAIRRELRATPRRALLRGRPVVVRVAGPDLGRMRVTVRPRGASKALVAKGRAVTSLDAQRLSLVVARKARPRLRALGPRPRLVVRVVVRRDAGGTVHHSRVVRLAARR